LADFEGIPDVAIPQTLRATLRGYQHEGYRWLQFLRQYDCGGILADDMGLGKSIQTITHLLREKERSCQADSLEARPSLLVVPTSLVPNWLAELERFAPSLRVTTLHGAQRKNRYAELETADLAITTYALLLRDELFLERDWHIAILDEAQAIKNPNSKVARAASKLRARQRICLTGTPMENHLGELWSLFDFVMPHALYDQRRFARLFRTPIEKESSSERRDVLARRIRPFVLRRTKADVALQLPEKTEIVERVELAEDQRDLYESVRLAVHEEVRREIERLGMARSRIAVLDALLKLRQVCCDPRLVRLQSAARAHSSAKLAWLVENLAQLAEEGRRTLVFSQFTSMLDLIKPELERAGIPFVELVGSTVDRATPVRRFQAGEVPVFLISLRAGGTGLNLTAADTVIHYDPWWNPAVERQATDRAHRIGQDKPVFVYKLIAAGTVEEKILNLQAHKAALAGALFDATKAESIELTAADVEELFKPLLVEA
jgi:SNF2 family DNA or RNA helicase